MALLKHARLRVFASLVAALLVAVAATAVALASTGTASQAHHAARSDFRGDIPGNSHASALVAAHYAVFRRPLAASARLRTFAHAVVRQVRVPHASTRSTPGSPTETSAVELADYPGSKLCVTAVVPDVHAGIEACGAESAAVTQPVIAVIASTQGSDVVAGPVPDGVTSVTITGDNGRTEEVPVRNNAYLATVSGGYHAQTLHFADGHSKTR